MESMQASIISLRDVKLSTCSSLTGRSLNKVGGSASSLVCEKVLRATQDTTNLFTWSALAIVFVSNWRKPISRSFSKVGMRSSKQKALAAAVKPAINRSEIVKRSFFYSQCPEADAQLPEIAVFGESNVGKSSMVNFLCGRKLLSTISKRPGHTKLIHHFLIDKSWYLVDLPGIGYAEGRGNQLKQMSKIVAAYVRHRETLVELLYLVDASQPPKDLDLQAMKWLVDSGVYISVVLTKTDLRENNETSNPIKVLSNALLQMAGSPWRLGQVKELPRMYLTSTKLKTGREELLEHIADIRRRCILGSQKRKMSHTTRAEAKNPSRSRVPTGPPPAIR